jgi:hypothetical protein
MVTHRGAGLNKARPSRGGSDYYFPTERNQAHSLGAPQSGPKYHMIADEP